MQKRQKLTLSQKQKKLTGESRRMFFIELREEYTLGEIGAAFGLSAERVRQVINHDIELENAAFESSLQKYESNLEKLNYNDLFKEVARLASYDRRKKPVEERRILMVFLKGKYGFSLMRLAHLFHRDHTSVLNLIKGKIAKRI